MIAKKEYRRRRQVVIGAIVFIAAGAAILWSYNTLAAELFGLMPMEFRHALAAEILLIVAGTLIGWRGPVHGYDG